MIYTVQFSLYLAVFWDTHFSFQIKGIKTINIVRRDSQVDELKAIGADYVINSEKDDVVARVLEITKV